VSLSLVKIVVKSKKLPTGPISMQIMLKNNNFQKMKEHQLNISGTAFGKSTLPYSKNLLFPSLLEIVIK
jgi:hypothetical protein